MKSKRPKHLAHLSAADPVMKALIKRVELPVRHPSSNHFHALARSIIGQQLSTKAAATITARVTALFNKGRAKTFPTPEAFLKMSDRKLRAAGLSFSKTSYIKNLARFFIKNRVTLKRIARLSDEEIIVLLTEIKGIGRWTVEMFLMFTLHREDVFSHGDLGLRNAIKKLYNLRAAPSLKRATQISDRWKPYRTYASLYLWASLSEK